MTVAVRETVGGAGVTSEVVVVVGVTKVVVGATVVVVGVPAKMFEATESTIALTALMVTEYAVPFVSPEMVNGLEVDAGFNAEYVTPSVEYL